MNNCVKIILLIGLFILCGAWFYLTIRDSHAYCTTSKYFGYGDSYSRSQCPSSDIKELCPAYAATFELDTYGFYLKVICPWSPPAWVSIAVGLAIIEIDLICLMFTLATKKIDQTRRPKWILAGLVVISFLFALGFVIRDIVVAAKYDIKQDRKYTGKSVNATEIIRIFYILVIFPACIFVNWVHGMPIRKRSRDQVSPSSENIARNTPGSFAVTPHSETVPMVSYNGAASPPINYTQAQQMQYPHNGAIQMVSYNGAISPPPNYMQVQQMQYPQMQYPQMQYPQSEAAPMVAVHNVPN